MALPVPVKSWQFNVGLTLAVGSYRDAFRGVKDALKGFPQNPIIIKGSSNAVTAGLDGVDRWGANGDLVATTSSSAARSWLLMRNAAGAEYLIDLVSTGASAETTHYSLYFSASGSFSGGTTTARPTAPDEVTAQTGAPWYWIHPLGGAECIGQILHSTDGKETRVIFCHSGSGYGGAWVMGEFADPPPSTLIAKPNYWLLDTFLLSPGSLYNNQSDNRGVMMFGGRRGRLGAEFAWSPSSQMTSLSEVTVANEINNAWPLVPMRLYTDAAPWIRGGKLKDLWMGAGVHALGTTYPAEGTAALAQFGRIVVPWNGSVPRVA